MGPFITDVFCALPTFQIDRCLLGKILILILFSLIISILVFLLLYGIPSLFRSSVNAFLPPCSLHLLAFSYFNPNRSHILPWPNHLLCQVLPLLTLPICNSKNFNKKAAFPGYLLFLFSISSWTISYMLLVVGLVDFTRSVCSPGFSATLQANAILSLTQTVQMLFYLIYKTVFSPI